MTLLNCKGQNMLQWGVPEKLSKEHAKCFYWRLLFSLLQDQWAIMRSALCIRLECRCLWWLLWGLSGVSMATRGRGVVSGHKSSLMPARVLASWSSPSFLWVLFFLYSLSKLVITCYIKDALSRVRILRILLKI